MSTVRVAESASTGGDCRASLVGLPGALRRAARRHGNRLCPRQVLGARIGLYAAERVGLAVPRRDKRLLMLIEIDGCFADGVIAATGCEIGRRTLRLLDYGRIAATAFDRETGRAVRVTAQPGVRERASEFAPDAPDRWHAQLVAYQVMPTSILLDARAVRLSLPLADLLDRPIRRTVCARCGEEVQGGREVQQGGDPVCRACALGGYYWIAD